MEEKVRWKEVTAILCQQWLVIRREERASKVEQKKIGTIGNCQPVIIQYLPE